MTREEAITVLKAFMKNPLFSEVHKAAFNIAIHDIKAYQDWNINNLILVNKDNYEPTTKNDLGVDCISREQALRELKESAEHHANDSREEALLRRDRDIIRALPSVTPQEPQTFKWCTDCKEYDQEKHCCHRWTKVIRNTVEEMKQGYIEREVLDKIRAEIERERSFQRAIDEYDIATGLRKALEIFDKYKAETEDT